MHTFELTQTPNAADSNTVSEGVFAFGRALATGGNAMPLACFVRQNGELVAGAVGRIEYGRLFVNMLWVSEPLRGQGLGSEVLERFEAEALRLDCTSALLETLNDRIAGLYVRLGYQTLAVVNGYVGPFNRHIMLKTLA